MAVDYRKFLIESRHISGSNLVLVTICGYFTLSLLPKCVPSIGTTAVFFLYGLSVVLLVVVLLAIAIGGGAALLFRWIFRRAHRGTRPSIPALTRVAGLSLVWLALVIVVSRSISGALPTGSYLNRFDPAIWQQRGSAQYVEGDITPRQKMLGDVVENVLPGKSRVDIENLLGPSLDTPYAKDTGRDLIYELGPERTSFFGIDSEWLLIWLDSSGRFSRYTLYTD